MANTRDTMGEQACLDALVDRTITSFEDDGVLKIGSNAFNNNTSIKSLILPSCDGINTNGCFGASNLEHVDMSGGYLNSSAFSGAKKLKTLILRGDSVARANSSNVFTNTPLEVKEGIVFVPDSLVSSYKSYSNSAYLSRCVIKPLSMYPTTDCSTIDDSWDEIIAACSDGSYSTKYSIGETKSIEIDGETCYMQLVGKDVDVLASDGTTTVPTSWLIFRRLYTNNRINSVTSKAYEWGRSTARSWLSETVLPLLPSNVQAAIKEVRKYSSSYASGAVVVDGCVTADKLWLPSAHEVNVSTTYETQGAAYSTNVYPTGKSSAATAKRIKYNSSNEATAWWTRSIASGTQYAIVSKAGYSGGYDSSYLSGVVFGFCI